MGARTHLDLARAALGAAPPDLVSSACICAGVLLALILYCFRDIGKLCVRIAHVARGKRSPARRFLFLILASSLPPLLGETFALPALGGISNPALIAGWAAIATGLVLFLADRLGLMLRRIEHVGSFEAAGIGLAWLLALVPGAGRTTGSMVLARFLGYERIEAARFALLIAIPSTVVVFATVAVASIETGIETGLALLPSADAATAGGLAFAAALAAIALMMQ